MRHGTLQIRQGHILLLAILVWIIWASGFAAPPTTSPTDEQGVEKGVFAPYHVLKAIRVVDTEVRFYLVRSGTDDIIFTAFKASDPLRLVVKMLNTSAWDVSTPSAVENEIISKIETKTLSVGSEPYTIVEMGLHQDTGYSVGQGGERIRLRFLADQQLLEDEAAQDEPVVQPAPETTTAAVADTPQPPEQEQIVPPPMVEKEPLPPASKVLTIRQSKVDEELRYYIIADGNLADYKAFHLTNPPRLVVDLMGVKSPELGGTLKFDAPWIKKIRVGTHTDKVRVVFDLIPEEGLPYQIILGDDRLMVSFKQGSRFPTQ